MKILYLHQYFVPPSAYGGVRSYEFAKRLIADGHDVTIITSSARLAGQYERTGLITHTEISGVPVVVIDVPYNNTMGFLRRIIAFLQFVVLAIVPAVRLPSDVIFATSTPLTIAIPAVIAKWIRRKPMVFEVRDLWPEVPIQMNVLKNPVFIWLARALEWVAYHQSNQIIALSEDMAEGVAKRGIDRSRITIIPNSSDTALFDSLKPEQDLIRQRLNLRPDQPIVVYAGTFGIVNGVDYLVHAASEALQQNMNLNFLLIGDGIKLEETLRLAEEKQVLNRNLWRWEPVSKNELIQLIPSATILTSVCSPIPALWNNSANKFFDALAGGKPIAVNHEGWQADLIREHQIGVVMPINQPAQAAHVLNEAVHNPEFLAQAEKASYQLAKTQFDRDLLYQKFHQVLKNAIS